MKRYRIYGSIAGKILKVDLSNNKIWVENTEKYASRFLGGRALGSWILLNEMDVETKWSDPENMLVISAGLLGGTLAPASGRTSIETKNAFSGGKGSVNFGGGFGPALKFAGFDSVVITGKSEKPVYLWIHDGTAEIRDAAVVWGKTNFKTEQILRRELGDEQAEVIMIGPAGEHVVRAASVTCDLGKVGGGSGVGCIMGDKKLKAIVASGFGAIRVARPDEFMKAVDVARKKVEDAPGIEAWRYGTIIDAGYSDKSEHEQSWVLWSTGLNGRDDYQPMEYRKKIIHVIDYRKKKWACFSCPIGCLPFSTIDKGKYSGTVLNSYWINNVYWSQKCGIDDPEVSLKYTALCNDLGLDGDNSVVAIAWAFECYEKGLLTKKDTDGLELTWGNGEAQLEMLRKLAYREGIGDLLADGVMEAAKKIGHDSWKFATTMKGQEAMDSYRVNKAWTLGMSTSPVAGRHLRGSSGSAPYLGPNRVSGEPTTVDPFDYEGQAPLVFWQARTKEIEDMTGLCNYVGTYFGPGGALNPSDYTDLINAATGTNFTVDDLMLQGQRSYNLEKAFNAIHTSWDREEDIPCYRYMNEPTLTGPNKGKALDRARYDKMLSEFYELNGWDVKTGLQTRKCLIELDLEDVAEMIHAVGRMIE